MTTQNARLLKYLQTHRKGLTQGEAFLRLGIGRLSERIRELESGIWGWMLDKWPQPRWKVDRKRERVKTRHGTATVTRYKLP